MPKHSLLLAGLLIIFPAFLFGQARMGAGQFHAPQVHAPQVHAPMMRGGAPAGHVGPAIGARMGAPVPQVPMGAPAGSVQSRTGPAVTSGRTGTAFGLNHEARETPAEEAAEHGFGRRIIISPGFGFGYSPLFWDWYYNPYWAYGRGLGYYGYPDYYDTGKVKLDHAPKDAQVFLNGAYAGTVGQLKSFRLEPGTYSIQVRDRGRDLFDQRIYVVRGKTIHADLASGEVR